MRPQPPSIALPEPPVDATEIESEEETATVTDIGLAAAFAETLADTMAGEAEAVSASNWLYQDAQAEPRAESHPAAAAISLASLPSSSAAASVPTVSVPPVPPREESPAVVSEVSGRIVRAFFGDGDAVQHLGGRTMVLGCLHPATRTSAFIEDPNMMNIVDAVLDAMVSLMASRTARTSRPTHTALCLHNTDLRARDATALAASLSLTRQAPRCVFKDVSEFLQPTVLQYLRGQRGCTVDDIQKLIRGSVVGLPSAICATHGRRCPHPRATLHEALCCLPAVDFAAGTCGPKALKTARSKCAAVHEMEALLSWVAWAVLRRHLDDSIILLHGVPVDPDLRGFVASAFDDKYDVRFHTSFCIMLHKDMVMRERTCLSSVVGRCLPLADVGGAAEGAEEVSAELGGVAEYSAVCIWALACVDRVDTMPSFRALSAFAKPASAYH